jgi:hypothetical protein
MMEVESSCKEEWSVESCMHGIGPASQGKLSDGIKLRKAIWEGTRQLLHFHQDGYTRAFDREVAFDSRG